MTAAPALPASSDAELLAEFRAARDGDAFAVLVKRYSPLVWSACRRVLVDRHLAEDAYQQTFAKLARRATTIDATRPLAGWLFKVARNTALKSVTKPTARLPETAAGDDPLSLISARELLGVLDAELGRLAEVDRAVLLLCGVENLSRDEAAARLGWSSVQVKKRLETARGRLRVRLEAKGLTLAVLATIAATASDAPAAVLNRASLAWSVPAAPLGLLRRSLFVGMAALAVAVSAPAPPAAPPAPAAAAELRTDRHGDALPADALLRLGTTRFRHGFMVSGIAYHPDGKTVALSGPGQDFIGLYEADTGRLVRKLGDKSWESRSIGFSPDGRLFAYAAHSQSVIVADADTGAVVKRLPAGWSWTLAWSPDGKRIVSGGEKSARVFDVVNWQELHVLTNGEQPIGTVAYLDGNRPVVGFENGDVQVFSPAGTRLRTLSAGTPGGMVTAARAGSRIAVSRREKGYTVFDADTGAKQADVAVPAGYSGQAAFSPDGTHLWVSGLDGSLVRCDAATGAKQVTVTVGPFASYYVALSPDGRTVAATSAWSSGIRRWDSVTGREIPAAVGPAHRGGIDGVMPHTNGTRAVTWGRDQVVYDWNLADGTASKLFDGFGDGKMYGSVAVSPDRKWLLGGSHVTRTISLWSLETGKKVRAVETFESNKTGPAVNVYPMTFSADSKTFAYGCPDGTVRVGTVDAEKPLARFAENGLGRPVTHLSFRDGGKELHITLGNRANIRWGAAVRWRWADAAPPKWLNFTHAVWMSHFSPDGSRVVAAAEWETAPTVWDAATGKKLYTLSEHAKGCYAAAFSPCGRMIATGGADKDDVVRLWDAATGTEFTSFRGQHSSIMCLAFTPDSRRLVTGAGDSTGVVWDLTGATAGRQPKSFAEAFRKLGLAGGPDVLPAVFFLAGSADGPAYLKEKLSPAVAPPAKVVEDLAAKLDAPAFAVRAKAEAELAKLGAGALPRLKACRDAAASAEVREKLKGLIEKYETGTDAVTARRAVWVAELGKSHELLTAWAGGEPDAVLTKEAKAALLRRR